MAYVVASVFFFGVITFVAVCTEIVTTQEHSHAGNHILFKEVVVFKKSWRWNYTPRREYPYIKAASKM
jgi:hypothetical protein